ncbi:protocadherin-like wing polarity protein stan [Acanthaster planci]|uniref:Protocadherin-like wing polarity protein stan n=1 Tax=Acanthaster planci TaxID=133434 RepID=A0A8B7YNS7_ACAPL|nr:protocadherin-like wing polarity protein stan [Acanthaster planci]
MNITEYVHGIGDVITTRFPTQTLLRRTEKIRFVRYVERATPRASRRTQTAMPFRTVLVLLLFVFYVSCGLTAAGEASRGRGRARSRVRRPNGPNIPRREEDSADQNHETTNDVGKPLVFSQDIYDAEVTEDAPVGSLVLTILASLTRNEDTNQDIGYQIKKRKTDKIAPPFRIDTHTGEIRTLRALDFETETEYTVLGYAGVQGNSKLKAKTKITIRVLNVDDVPLRFTRDSYEAYINENKIGQVNNSVELQQGDSQVVFMLMESVPLYGIDMFRINPGTGEVSTTTPLDREEFDKFILVVVANSRKQSAQTRLVVHVNDLNDNPPTFPHHVMTFRIYENARCWLPLNATDKDIGENAVVKYRIAWGRSRSFMIEEDTGVIRNIRRIDYERNKIFRLVVNAYSGNLFGYTRVVIRVIDTNDNPPILNDFQVIYNALPDSLSGAELTRVPAQDVDREGTLRYGIVPGRSRWNNLVKVDEITGIISLSKKKAKKVRTKVVTDITFYVTDGVHGAQASCLLELTPVSIEMMANGVSVNVLNVTGDNFLRSARLQALRDALAYTLNSHANQLVIFNLQEVARDGYPLLNVSFAARDLDNKFLSREYILSTIYFERRRIEEMSGLPILPAEDDVCVLESCNDLQRCVPKKILSQISSVFAHSRGDLITFRGVHPAVEHTCECPDIYSFNNCSEVVDFCESQPCSNGGTCEGTDGGYTCICPYHFAGDNCEIDFSGGSCFEGACKHGGQCVDLDEGGFTCDCMSGYDGQQCEMTSRFFPAGSYMTFPTLNQRSMMRISLNFSTEMRNGLLLYVSRYSQVNDLLAIEIIDTQIAFSFAVGKMTMRVMVGTPGGVSDLKWHLVELVYRDKMVEVMLDSCERNEEGEILSNFPCVAYATQALDVSTWFLDVNTPLLVGSIPANQEEERILSREFIGCIRDVRIDNKVLDFADSLTDSGTEPGCPLG